MAVKKDKQLWWQLCTLVLWQGRPAEGASMLQWSFLLFYSLASYTRHTHVYTRIHTHVYTRCQQSPKKARLSSSRVQTHTLRRTFTEPTGKVLLKQFSGQLSWSSYHTENLHVLANPTVSMLPRCSLTWMEIPTWARQVQHAITQSAGVNSDLITSDYPSSQDSNIGLPGGHGTGDGQGDGH